MDLQKTLEATFIRPPSTQNDVQKADSRTEARIRDEERGIDNRFDEDLNAEMAREAQRQREAQEEAARAAKARRAQHAAETGNTDQTAVPNTRTDRDAPTAADQTEATAHADDDQTQATGAETSDDQTDQHQDGEEATDNTASASEQQEDNPSGQKTADGEKTEASDAPVSDLQARLAANEALKAQPQAAQQAIDNAAEQSAVSQAQQTQVATNGAATLESGITVSMPQQDSQHISLQPLVMTPGQAAMQGNATGNTGNNASGNSQQAANTITVDMQALMNRAAGNPGEALQQSAQGQGNKAAQFKLDLTNLNVDTQALGLQAPTNMSATTAATAIKAADSVAPTLDMSGTSNQVSGIDALRLSSDTTTQTQVARAAPPQVARPPAEQLAVQINKNLDKGVNRFEIKLNPAELGRVEVKMEVGFDGRMQATVSVERAETLHLLQRDSHTLERALQDAGLKTDQNSLEFTLKDQGQGSGQGEEQDGSFAGNADQPADEVTTENIVTTLRHPLGQGVLDIHA